MKFTLMSYQSSSDDPLQTGFGESLGAAMKIEMVECEWELFKEHCLPFNTSTKAIDECANRMVELGALKRGDSIAFPWRDFPGLRPTGPKNAHFVPLIHIVYSLPLELS